LWVLRGRPAWFGLVLAFGFLHREFAVYGFTAWLAIEALGGRLFTWAGAERVLTVLASFACGFLLVELLHPYASAVGPGTSEAEMLATSTNLGALAGRTCLSPAAIATGLGRLATVHWIELFGGRRTPLVQFNIESRLTQGVPGGWVLIAGMVLIALGVVGWRVVRSRPHWETRFELPVFLLLVGIQSAVAYAAARCGEVHFQTRRYDLLSLLGCVGLAAWYLQVEGSRIRRGIWVTTLGIWVGLGAVAHAGLLREYVQDPPQSSKQLIARHLTARGVRYGIAEYWIAYHVTFLTREQVIVASYDFVRIRPYELIVRSHIDEAVQIDRRPCQGGREVMDGVFFCTPSEGWRPPDQSP
jgi:hypothetical protein